MDEALQELASLYALGMLRGEELTAFEAQLATNEELQAFVKSLQEVADGLAFSLTAVIPPSSVRDRLFKTGPAQTAPRAAPVAPAVAPKPLVLAPPAPPVAENVVPITASRVAGVTKLAAVISLLATGFAVIQAIVAHDEKQKRGEAENLVLSLEKERDSLRAESAQQANASAQALAAARAELATSTATATHLEADLATLSQQHSAVSAELVKVQAESGYDNARIAVLKTTPSAPKAAAKAVAVSVWNQAKQHGVLLVENLPALPANKNYQLWVLDEGKPVSGGVLSVDAKGNGRVTFNARKTVNTASQFAITVEPLGEQENPTISGMVLAGQ